MLKYTVQRLVELIPTLLGILLLTFTLGFYGPGDPLQYQIGERIPEDPDAVARLRHIYGLDRPYHVQLADYFWKFLHGDLGKSLAVFQGWPVRKLLLDGLLISMQIGAVSMILLVIIGIPLGVLAAYKHNTWIDYLIVSSSVVFTTVPVFVLAPILLIVFVMKLDWIDEFFGWKGLFDQRVILPLVVLTVGPLLGVVRQTRAAVLEQFGRDYLRTARAKGLSERFILLRHLLKNALSPVATALSFRLGTVLTGAFFMEALFGIPGFGGLIFRGLRSYDYPVIMATTMVGGVFIMGANLVADLMYGILDPRVREVD